MKGTLFFIIFFVLAFSACTNYKQNMLDSIHNLQAKVDTNKSKNALDSLSRMYLQYAEKYAKDSLSPIFLMYAGRINLSNGNGEEAIAIFNNLIKKYPDNKYYPAAMFLKAFTYENTMGNLAKARIGYKVFLDSFPKHSLSDEARLCIENLGVLPEKLLQKIQPALDSSNVNKKQAN